MRESQAELRRSVWNLRSVKLEEATLPEALQQLGKALADTHGPNIEVHCEGEPTHVPPGVASHLFRIAQEAVTNALKHAYAQRIEIILAFTQQTVELRVTDDGRGFDTAAAPSNGQFGVRGLRERARALGAEIRLDSQPGSGTRVRLTVPASRLKEN